jgi:hypothetical protein
MLRWLKLIVGIVFVAVGALWILQGLNVIQGSIMSGQTMWFVIGVIVLLLGAWLLWTMRRVREDVSVG